MLSFCNKKIYLDFELYDSYDIEALMLCKNPFMANPHPKELYKDSLTITDLESLSMKDVFMTPSQLKAFIKEWIKNTHMNINSEEWFNDYIDCIKQLSNIMGDYDYTDRNSIFRERQKWFIENIEIEDVQSPIIFDKEVSPEYSWKVKDYLDNKKTNTFSMFSEEIEENIKINICKCVEYQNKANIFGNEYLIFKPFNNCESINDLCYLYFPLSGESVNSNFIYIKKCLEKYLEK